MQHRLLLDVCEVCLHGITALCDVIKKIYDPLSNFVLVAHISVFTYNGSIRQKWHNCCAKRRTTVQIVFRSFFYELNICGSGRKQFLVTLRL